MACEATAVSGSFVDICPDGSAPDIRADLVVAERPAVRIWGQVRNLEGQPLAGVLLKLARISCSDGCECYEGVAHTASDCNGIYQFELCAAPQAVYRIFAGAQSAGPDCCVPTCRVCDERCGCGGCPSPGCCLPQPAPVPDPDPCAPPPCAMERRCVACARCALCCGCPRTQCGDPRAALSRPCRIVF